MFNPRAPTSRCTDLGAGAHAGGSVTLGIEPASVVSDVSVARFYQRETWPYFFGALDSSRRQPRPQRGARRTADAALFIRSCGLLLCKILLRSTLGSALVVLHSAAEAACARDGAARRVELAERRTSRCFCRSLYLHSWAILMKGSAAIYTWLGVG